MAVIRAAHYVRVSTTDKGQDRSMQKVELTSYAQRRGWETKVYRDQQSGAKENRPGLNALLADVRRRCDAVAVWSLDRLASVGLAPKLGGGSGPGSREVL